MTTTPEQTKTYYISYSQGSRYILCLACNKPSYDTQDIENKRCPYCKKKHT